MSKSSRFSFFLERLTPAAVFSLLLLYTYVELVYAPYLGFNFVLSTGEIPAVFVENPLGPNLEPGDRLQQIDAVTWADYRSDLRHSFLDRKTTGDLLSLQVKRGGETLLIPWRIPEPTLSDVFDRFVNIWWLAYVFWWAGTATMLNVRPKGTRWRLLIAFYFLTAIWLIAGNTSRWHLWESAIVLRTTIWLCVPIYLHLHWVFPQRLRSLPSALWWCSYTIAALLAVLQWFQRIPSDSYILGFMFAFIGSLVLLGVHFLAQPQERRAIRLLLIAMLLTVVCVIGVSLAQLFQTSPQRSYAALLVLPLIPGAYFYSTYRHQLGGLELRTNRLIALYLFLILLGITWTLLVSSLDLWFNVPVQTIFISVTATLLAAVVTGLGFPAFRRFVDARLLGISLPLATLLPTYAAHIATSLELDTLTHLLQNEVLSSLLVRQSVLLRLYTDHIETVYRADVEHDQLPASQDIPALLAEARQVRRPSTEDSAQRCPWVRLILPLKVGDQLIGLWLLGRRDPDDFYSQSEFATFQALADQTAIALTNIDQAEQLRMLYQANIDRSEMERTNLARILHDEVLNLFPVLFMRKEDLTLSPKAEKTYQELATRIRQILTDLRPVLLTYSLGGALEEFVDALAERAGTNVKIQIKLTETQVRFAPRVEEYLFRIVQQACENSLHHARARTIGIYGALDANYVNLTVEDDGVGFSAGTPLDLSRLLANKHFGLIGMYERATIIGANLSLTSTPGQGTRVTIIWEPKERPKNILK